MISNAKEQNDITIEIFESIQSAKNPLDVTAFDKDKVRDVLAHLYEQKHIVGLKCSYNIAGRPMFDFLDSLRLTKSGLDYYEKLTGNVTDIILSKEERRLKRSETRANIALFISTLALVASIYSAFCK